MRRKTEEPYPNASCEVISMRKVNLFVEDFGHETFLEPLLQRFARQYSVLIETKFVSSRGGYGTVVSELRKYMRDLQRGRGHLPDLVIVATDGNCKGQTERKRQIDEITKSFNGPVICAIPDPHIERWLLLDSAAFKKVLGKGCLAPVQKCERDLYKRLLITSVRDAGKEPVLDGIEYAEQLVRVMDLEYLEKVEESLGKFLKDLRRQFQEWQRAEQNASHTPSEG